MKKISLILLIPTLIFAGDSPTTPSSSNAAISTQTSSSTNKNDIFREYATLKFALYTQKQTTINESHDKFTKLLTDNPERFKKCIEDSVHNIAQEELEKHVSILNNKNVTDLIVKLASTPNLVLKGEIKLEIATKDEQEKLKKDEREKLISKIAKTRTNLGFAPLLQIAFSALPDSVLEEASGIKDLTRDKLELMLNTCKQIMKQSIRQSNIDTESLRSMASDEYEELNTNTLRAIHQELEEDFQKIQEEDTDSVNSTDIIDQQ